MPDREKVIKGLEHCVKNDDCRGCVYFEEYSKIIYCSCSRDALELLKEQDEETQNLRRENHNILTQFHEWAKEQEAKTGNWIEKEDYNLDTYYDCSVCGESWITIDGTPWQNGMNYCPHCGAKMESR